MVAGPDDEEPKIRIQLELFGDVWEFHVWIDGGYRGCNTAISASEAYVMALRLIPGGA